MEIEQGIIQRTSSHSAWVRIQERAGCATCSSRGSCELGSRQDKMTVEVANTLNATIGDHVEISMPEGSLMKLSFMVYFLPVVGLILGAAIGSRLAVYTRMDESLTSILGGIILVSIVFGLLKYYERRSKVMDKYRPSITRILSHAPSSLSCDSQSRPHNNSEP